MNILPLGFLTYHKFVKTTPNPKATKKSKGELVGPPPPPPPPPLLLPLLDVAAGELPMVGDGVSVREAVVDATALITAPKVRIVHGRNQAHDPT